MTTTNEKTPAPGATGNEGMSTLESSSTATAYLALPRDNTRDTFGTWSGAILPMKDHITIIVPIEVAQRMYADGPQLVGLNRECADAQSREARKLREERKAKERARLRSQISEEVELEFEDELTDLEDKITELHRRIDAKAEERLSAEYPEVTDDRN